MAIKYFRDFGAQLKSVRTFEDNLEFLMEYDFKDYLKMQSVMDDFTSAADIDQEILWEIHQSYWSDTASDVVSPPSEKSLHSNAGGTVYSLNKVTAAIQLISHAREYWRPLVPTAYYLIRIVGGVVPRSISASIR